MSTQPNIRKASLLPAAIAMLIVLVGCQPEELVFDPQSGRWVSPLPTPTSPTSPLPTPIVTSGPTPTPYPTPWPPDFTPGPTTTSTPPADPLLIYDAVNRFSLRLLPGWYAVTPGANAVGGVTSISTYDMRLVDDPPPGSMSIHITVSQLDAEQSFEQWLSDRRARETSPEYGAGGIILTEPQPYTLGRYTGVTYTARDSFSNEGVTIIYLLTSDGRIVGIGVRPADSQVLSNVLPILSTLDVSPIPAP